MRHVTTSEVIKSTGFKLMSSGFIIMASGVLLIFLKYDFTGRLLAGFGIVVGILGFVFHTKLFLSLLQRKKGVYKEEK